MAEHQKWEHRARLMDGNNTHLIASYVRALGMEGWQLCAINSPYYWFKRPILTQEKQDG